MAKPKGWTKRNRAWLNTPASCCMAGVSWNAGDYYSKEWDKDLQTRDDKYTCVITAEISINDEAKNHYVSRKADLRPLRAMRKELDAFEEACLEACQEAEDYNNGES